MKSSFILPVAILAKRILQVFFKNYAKVFTAPGLTNLFLVGASVNLFKNSSFE